MELTGTNELSFYGQYHKNDDREAVMEEIERRRAQTVYQHGSADCSDDCKKRGAIACPLAVHYCLGRYPDNSSPGQFAPDNSPPIFKQIAPRSFIHYRAKRDVNV